MPTAGIATEVPTDGPKVGSSRPAEDVDPERKNSEVGEKNKRR